MTKYGEDIAAIKTCVQSIKSDIVVIKKTLNGKDGLVTQTEVQKVSLKRLWGFCTFLGICLVSGAIKAIFFPGGG